MENEVMVQPQGIKTFIEIGLKEIECEEKKPEPEKVAIGNLYSVEAINDQDVVIKRKTKASEKILAIIMSQGIFYIKNMKNETILKDPKGRDIKYFMKDADPDGEACQAILKLSWVKNAKIYKGGNVQSINSFCYLMDQIIACPHKIAMCQYGLNASERDADDFFWEIYKNMNTDQNIKVACEIIKKADNIARKSNINENCMYSLYNNAFMLFYVYGIDVMRMFFASLENGRVKYAISDRFGIQQSISALKELENKDETSYKLRGFTGMLVIMMKRYNLKPSRFFDYLFNEIYSQGYASITYSFFNTYIDTLSLQIKCYNNHLQEKYPKYLDTEHRSLTLKYSFIKELYDAKIFKSRSKENGYLKYSKGKYVIIVPESPDEVVDEGMNNHNCVASYVSSIVNGNTFVCFMRNKEKPGESLMTIEIRNGALIQAEGCSRRSPNNEERDFLKTFCKEKELNFQI